MARKTVSNALSPKKAVTSGGKPSSALLKPQKAPLFSGAEPHPHKNLGRFLHSSKKRA